MSSKEKKELETLEKENLKTIEEFHRALIGDRQIQTQNEKMKLHPGINVVEGREYV